MPWLPMYLSEGDARALLTLLSEDADIAFLESDGPKKWRAVKSISFVDHRRIGLWHLLSGPLPLLPKVHGGKNGEIRDPWAGWEERRIGADPNTPYFGAGHPGVFWLNIHVGGREPNSCCGMSSFEWIGNKYRVIGNAASPETEIWWKTLRKKIDKLAHKVPRQSLSSTLPPEIFAFSGAYNSLTAGGIADNNPPF